jgi:hypothetical protein
MWGGSAGAREKREIEKIWVRCRRMGDGRWEQQTCCACMARRQEPRESTPTFDPTSNPLYWWFGRTRRAKRRARTLLC